MANEIRVPTLGESVTAATIGKWFKKAGDAVAADEPLVELETDKVTIEVPAPSDGTLSEILVEAGETVGVGALLGSLGEATAEHLGTRVLDVTGGGEQHQPVLVGEAREAGDRLCGRVGTQLVAVAAGELVEPPWVVAVPAPQLGAGCHVLAPLVELEVRLADATWPQAVDQHEVTGDRMVVVVDPVDADRTL